MTQTPAFPLIEVAGAAFERGRQYGRLARDRVHICVQNYRGIFEQKGVTWLRARELAAQFMPRIDAYSKELAEEIRGIAAGSDLPVEEIVAINSRTELMYGKHGHRPGEDVPDDDGCTGVIALPPATADGHTLHGQNWDWRDEAADCGIVLKLTPERGPSILCFVEAGMLARAGMNSAGVAVTGNFLECERDARREGIPLPLVRRQVLAGGSLGAAIQAVYQSQRMFSNNLMISQADGEAIDLETTPDEVFWISPEDDLLVHSNHFVSAAARAKVIDTGLRTNGDSLYRDRRVRRYLVQDHTRINVDTLRRAFQDRYGSPRAVCRTPVSGPGGKTSSTVATVIMDTTARRMWIAPRPYGPHEFTEYRL
ncbi:MAG TPA: C45 family peptidase [Steroidobacteraceae bacterium]|nr:C45 family peptidase [Steroidobacteraceae bacterium]